MSDEKPTPKDPYKAKVVELVRTAAIMQNNQMSNLEQSEKIHQMLEQFLRELVEEEIARSDTGFGSRSWVVITPGPISDVNEGHV